MHVVLGGQGKETREETLHVDRDIIERKHADKTGAIGDWKPPDSCRPHYLHGCLEVFISLNGGGLVIAILPDKLLRGVDSQGQTPDNQVPVSDQALGWTPFGFPHDDQG